MSFHKGAFGPMSLDNKFISYQSDQSNCSLDFNSWSACLDRSKAYFGVRCDYI